MSEPIDTHFIETVTGWIAAPPGHAGTIDSGVRDADLLELLAAQLDSRHLDFAARQLQRQGEGFYTIGSAGHESDAAVAMALRPTDPALLHYRSGGFYCARARQVPGSDAVRDILRSLTSSADDPISGGRHKVFGSRTLSIIPQTSTIASHLPRAVGLAFSLGRPGRAGIESPWPPDSVVVASLGDASVNHSTAVGALNAAGHTVHQGVPVPLLVVCEDNGIGISTRTPAGWTAATLSRLPGFTYVPAVGADPVGALDAARRAAAHVRESARPAILHLRTVRFLGHAGSDAEIAYRSRAEIERDYVQDPLLATAAELVARGVRTPQEVIAAYDRARSRVAATAAEILPVRRLTCAEAVAEPLRIGDGEAVLALARPGARRGEVFGGKLPEEAGPLTLSQALNAALRDVLATHAGAIVFGEDVATKGGVYGVTRGLRKAFGSERVFDTLLDEQAILGTALGSALAGFLPIPEIQYLAYLHNAEDQLRGEAASLAFFSNGQYRNGMLVRIAGLAYQKGFGGHFHNDNSLAVLRDIPGLVLAVPASAAEAPGLVRALAGLAHAEGTVCVLVEPIALYHARDLHPEDGAWRASYAAPEDWARTTPRLGRGEIHGGGGEVLIVTFGNGVPMSLRAAAAASRASGIRADVFDLRWLAPLPVEHLLALARGYRAVLVADETRRSGGVSESVVTALVDRGYDGPLARVTSQDSVIPLGPAAETVLLSEADIRRGIIALGALGGKQ